MSRQTPYGEANAPTFRRRPRAIEVPLADVHTDDAYVDRQDHLWSLYEDNQARDRLDDHESRPWPPAPVVALPVVGLQPERRAA